MNRYSPKKTILWMLLFWNPLLNAFFCAVGLERSLEDWLLGMVISDWCFLGCYGAAFVTYRIRARLFAKRGLPAPAKSAWLGFLVSGLALPPVYYSVLAVLTLWLEHRRPHLGELAWPMFVSYAIIAVFAVVRLVYELRDAKRAAELRAKEAENALLRAQLSQLTAQMNPHLLFNALNTIASLTQSDPSAAEQTTLMLAELYRRVLDATKRDTHSLSDELAICRAYLAIEKTRFGERLAFDIDAAFIDTTLPVLSLQPLVENAVKHGIAPLPKGGAISIRAAMTADGLRISVEDTGAGLAAGDKPSSTALSNLRSRLSLIYGEAAGFSLGARAGGGTVAQLALPK